MHLVWQAGTVSINSVRLSRARNFLMCDSIGEQSFGVADSYWADSLPSRPKLQLVSYLNLLKGAIEDLTSFLKYSFDDIGSVTHAFHFGQFVFGRCWSSNGH